MLRLLYITDTHIRGTTPRARRDDFPLTLLQKLREVQQLVITYQVAAVLHGGDVFDRPLLSPSIVGTFAQCFTAMQVPIYAIAGNHDLYGHNPLTLGRTVLGLLHSLRIMHVLEPDEAILFKGDGVCLQVTGRSFHPELDRRPAQEDYDVPHHPRCFACPHPFATAVPLGEGDVPTHRIHMVHGMLCERALPLGVPHTRVADALAVTQADLLLTGHDHGGFSLREQAGTYALNPGALARLYGQPSDWQRRPQAALLTVVADQAIRVEMIPLREAPLGTEVLDQQAAAAHAYRQEQLASFAQQVRAATDLGTIDPTALVAELAAMHTVDPLVRDRALAYLQDATQEEEEEA